MKMASVQARQGKTTALSNMWEYDRKERLPMLKKSLLFLVVVSTLIIAGCFITGRVVDKNGIGLPGVTVTLSGGLSRTTTTDSNGTYLFGDISNDIIPAGSYIVTPSVTGDTLTPASRNVTISAGPLEGYGVVPWPVGNVDFAKESAGVISLPTTGQTTCYSSGDVINCQGSGQDGKSAAAANQVMSEMETHAKGTPL